MLEFLNKPAKAVIKKIFSKEVHHEEKNINY